MEEIMVQGPRREEAKYSGGCTWWMVKKRRFCASPALLGSEFCGNHRPSQGSTRVPCPVDPSHTILEADVKSHIKKCSATKQLNHIESQPYFSHNVNAGSEEEDESASSTRRQALDGEDRSCEAKRLDFSGISSNQFVDFVRRIERAHEESGLGNEEESYLQPSECSKWWDPDRDRRLPFQEKHVSQQASLLGNLAAFGLIKDESEKSTVVGRESDAEGRKNRVFVEFGAGRGYLSHMLCDSYGISSVVLVERRAYKFKADRTLRQLLGVSVERLRIDIENLSMRGIRSIQGRLFLAISKHLCGPATDLMLRCCLNGNRASIFEHLALEAQVNDPVFEGLGIATCCHHLCQWRSYVNKKYFQGLGFYETEFNMITWLTSWAVNSNGEHDHSEAENRDENTRIRNSDCKRDIGRDFEKEKDSQPPSDQSVVGSRKNELPEVMQEMDPVERATLGRKCKDLLDHGRLLWLKDRGLSVKMVKYIPSQITPENKLLLARVAGP